jgi:hypothetical protein
VRHVYTANNLTGGTVTDMDALSEAVLVDGDLCLTITGSVVYVHKFVAASTAAESSPTAIRPDDYTTSGVWILQNSPIGTAGIDSIHNIGNAGTSLDLSTVLYDTHICDQTTLTVAASDWVNGRTLNLVITNAGGCTITWPTGWTWANSTTPVFSSSGTDRVIAQKISSSLIHAAKIGAF